MLFGKIPRGAKVNNESDATGGGGGRLEDGVIFVSTPLNRGNWAAWEAWAAWAAPLLNTLASGDREIN